MGFFKMFRKPKTAVKLEIPKKSLSLGSKTVATISVSSKEEFDATEIRAELRCVEKVKRENWVYNERLRRNVRHVYWDTATLLSDDLKASGSMHIVPGLEKNSRLKFTFLKVDVKPWTVWTETFRGLSREWWL